MSDSRRNALRRRLSRRALLVRAGALAGAAAAPALLACRGSRSSRFGSVPSQTPAVSLPVRGGTLNVRMTNDVSVLDYAFNHDVYSSFVIRNCVEPLVTLDTHAQPAGLLASSWESPDPQTYIFRLRPDVIFHDGTPLNAEAAAYSLDRTRTDKSSFNYADLSTVDSIQKPERLTLKITLAAPFSPFLVKLSGDAGRIISPAIGERYGKDRLKTDLSGQGTGPFRFLEWKSGDHVTLTRNESYWGRDDAGNALPYLDRVIARPIPDEGIALASLRTGEIDGFRPNGTEGPPPKDAAAVQADPSLRYREIPGLGFSYIVFNQAREPFNHKELRQAVSFAIDRAVIVKNVFYDLATPLDVVFASSIWAADPDYHPYLKRDLARARQLLAQAGRPNGFAFTYVAQSGDPVVQQLGELIKDQLSEAGIQMTIQHLEFAKLTQALTAGEHQAGYLGWSTTYDPDDWVYPHFSSRGSLSVRSRYSNAAVDRLLDGARAATDVSKRKQLYQEAQRIVMDDAVYCVIHDRNWGSLSSSRVQNYPLGPTPAVGVSQVWKSD